MYKRITQSLKYRLRAFLDPASIHTPNTRIEAQTVRFRRCVVARVTGGLANQMIAYKFGRYVAHHFDRLLILETSFYNSSSVDPNRNLQLNRFNIRYDAMVSSRDWLDQAFPREDQTVLCGPDFYEFKNPNVMAEVARQIEQGEHVIIGDIFTALAIRQQADDFMRGEPWRNEFGLDRQKHFGARDHEIAAMIRHSESSVAVHVRRGDFATHDGNLLLRPEYLRSQ